MNRETRNRNRTSNGDIRWQLALAGILAGAIVACRLGIDTPNFQPVMAIALFSGFLFSSRWTGLATVLTGQLLSDALIGFYQWQLAIVVYAALAAPLLAGAWLRRRQFPGLVLGAGLAGSAVLAAVLFYLATSLAIWAWTPWYADDLSGLGTCLVMGLPFFKWSLAGNLVFSAVLFGGRGLTRRVADAMPGRRTGPWRRRPVLVPVRRHR